MSEPSESAWPPEDIRPVVASTASSNLGMWVFFAILGIGGIALFLALNANRQTVMAPDTIVPRDDPAARIAAPPPLPLSQDLLGRRDLAPAEFVTVPSLPEPRRIVQIPAEPVQPMPRLPSRSPMPLPVEPLDIAPGPRVVFDNRPTGLAQPAAIGPAKSNDRVEAGRFVNPGRTIPQGTVIPAVLETALDSTRPGAARALVQRNIYSFDGSRVLIHRGSRLYGNYEADLASGQNRALIQWTRLIRPDGVTIALDSPSSDPLGRAGIKGKVDSKFFQRFGGAILQSVLDLGVAVASREATNGVIVALPGSTQNVQVQQQGQVQPTLKVRHGTSVSVFVARDLDFSTVEF